jgi:acyl-CoA synthetase (AMP-forming)/AMP-acid ligase II
MEFNLADLFEAVVDAVPANEAFVLGSGGQGVRRFTYVELEARANQLAHVLAARGVGVGDHVGLHLHNGVEYVEAMLALYKLRATPVNVNYRYVADELRYLFADADLRAVLTEPELEPLVAEVEPALPQLTDLLVIGAGYEAELAAASDERIDVGPRSADDLYLLYTGGTTGLPKGVMWRHEDLYFASLGGRGTPSKGIPALTEPAQIGERARRGDPISRRLPLCPLMHGGAMWVALQTLLNGGALVIDADRHFDADRALSLMAAERVELVMLIGDATGRPLADLLAADPTRYDLSRLQVIASGGAILSPPVKATLLDALPHIKVVDTFGASETGGQGRLASPRPGGTAGTNGTSSAPATAGPPRLLTDEHTAVFDEELRRIEPGSDQIGRLARSGWIPFGYYKDPVKTAATFPVVDGVRWSVPGDMAKIEADGTVVLLGRGAMCINTGGEKVFPEEVEGAIKRHPAVFDAMVVGLPDERFGQRVVAVVSLRDGAPVPTAEELTAHTRTHVSGYKVPRSWVVVDTCERLPTGKPDYQWATRTAAQNDAPEHAEHAEHVEHAPEHAGGDAHEEMSR